MSKGFIEREEFNSGGFSLSSYLRKQIDFKKEFLFGLIFVVFKPIYECFELKDDLLGFPATPQQPKSELV